MHFNFEHAWNRLSKLLFGALGCEVERTFEKSLKLVLGHGLTGVF